jgi:hypothetical protein
MEQEKILELLKNQAKCLDYFISSVCMVPDVTAEEEAEYSHYLHLAREFIAEAKEIYRASRGEIGEQK